MNFLREEPPVPADLIDKILDRTSGASLPQLAVVDGVQSVPQPVVHFKASRTFRDARMLMTAAMAFFSIALTLNMIGIRLDTLHMADLKPAALQTTIARQFYGAKKQMVSYYENIRLVYEVESKVRELRRDAESEQTTQPRKDEKQQQNNPQGDGHKTGGRLQTPPSLTSPKTVICGKPVLASLDHADPIASRKVRDAEAVEVVEVAVSEETDQAERSLA
jgi:hypothetical protein